MYFTAAHRCLEEAEIGARQTRKRRQAQLDFLCKESEVIESRLNLDDRDLDDDKDYVNAMERISIRIENQGASVGFAYGPILENIAMTHLLWRACLEAHINRCAEDRLSSREFADFDRMNVTGKWFVFSQAAWPFWI